MNLIGSKINLIGTKKKQILLAQKINLIGLKNLIGSKI
jgi:hypothetical protein